MITKLQNLEAEIVALADKMGILSKNMESRGKQLLKSVEEVGELFDQLPDAVIGGEYSKAEIEDAIGDTLFTLVVIYHQLNTKPTPTLFSDVILVPSTIDMIYAVFKVVGMYGQLASHILKDREENIAPVLHNMAGYILILAKKLKDKGGISNDIDVILKSVIEIVGSRVAKGKTISNVFIKEEDLKDDAGAK